MCSHSWSLSVCQCSNEAKFCYAFSSPRAVAVSREMRGIAMFPRILQACLRKQFFISQYLQAHDIEMGALMQELVCDVHCIIEAMIARSSDVVLMKPQLVDTPQFLLGDSDRLRGILLNLYTNAAKFTRTGAISLRVSVHGPNYRPQPSQHSVLYNRDKQVLRLLCSTPLPQKALIHTTQPLLNISPNPSSAWEQFLCNLELILQRNCLAYSNHIMGRPASYGIMRLRST